VGGFGGGLASGLSDVGGGPVYLELPKLLIASINYHFGRHKFKNRTTEPGPNSAAASMPSRWRTNRNWREALASLGDFSEYCQGNRPAPASVPPARINHALSSYRYTGWCNGIYWTVPHYAWPSICLAGGIEYQTRPGELIEDAALKIHIIKRNHQIAILFPVNTIQPVCFAGTW
jgi:hypothetical protein